MNTWKKSSTGALPGSVTGAGASLRQKAENQIKRKRAVKASQLSVGAEHQRNEADTLKLLHELEVHQVELEMQNEELKLAVERAETAIALYDFAPAGYFTLERDGTISELNLNGAGMLGKNRSVLIKSNFRLFITYDTSAGFNDFFKNAFKTNAKQTCEGRLLIDGKPSIYVHIEGIVTKDEQKCYIAVIDITERKLVEIALKEKIEDLHRMTTIVSDSNDAVILRDLNGAILSWNRGAIEMYGYSEAEALGMNSMDMVAESDSEAAKVLVHRIIKGEILKSFELRRVAKDGRILDVWMTTTLLTDENGRPQAIATTERDITERRQKEVELITAKEKAEESDRLKTAFMNNISHEIRTPMNAIVGFADFLNDPDLDDSERKRFTDIIIHNSNQLLSIITDIVSVATIEAGQEKVHEKEVNINSIFKTINKQLLLKNLNKHVTLHFKTTLADEQAFIITDENKLTRIIANLVGNALKFTSQGRIELGYQQKGDKLEFYVKDTGIGIPPEMHTEIFKRFRQVEITPEHIYGGSGLGLSISKSYVELLGGEIWVDLEPGKGSTFLFTIPFKKVRKYDLSKTQPGIGLSTEFTRDKTILIAEDEDFNYGYLLVLLSKIGFNIIRAVNGAEIIKICQSDQAVDLVLMDIKMPVMDGYKATIKLKRLRPTLPVIAQSAYCDEDDITKAFASGCSDFISKPFKRELLLSKINKHLVSLP